MTLDARNNEDSHAQSWLAEEVKIEESKPEDLPYDSGRHLLTVPGAETVFPSNFLPREGSHVDEESTVFVPTGVNNTGDDKPLVAHLVEDSPPLPSTIGTVIDTKRRRVTNVIIALSFVAVVSTITGIAVKYTRPKPVTATSPPSSHEPSSSPSPSASPSTSLFGFLAAHSFDRGYALSTPGSPQQKAMDWLLSGPGLSAFNYKLLQNYVLATLYYATFSGTRTISDTTTSSWLTNYTGFCIWQGVVCNGDGEITSLQLSSNQLLGLIPGELAILDQSLSKIPECTVFIVTQS